MKPQLQMLTQMLQAIVKTHNCPPEEAYDIMVRWIAVHTGFEIQLFTDGIQKEAYETLQNVFDLELLQSEKHDWFGDLMVKEGIIPSIASQEDADVKMTKALDGIDFTEAMPKAVLIRNAWTGRDIFAGYKLTGDGALFFAMEPNKRLYQAAILNMHIHNIPAQILHADSRVVDASIASENWRQSNLWNPIKQDKLKQL